MGGKGVSVLGNKKEASLPTSTLAILADFLRALPSLEGGPVRGTVVVKLRRGRMRICEGDNMPGRMETPAPAARKGRDSRMTPAILTRPVSCSFRLSRPWCLGTGIYFRGR